MGSQHECDECGAFLPVGSPGGFCAACLLGLGLDPEQPASDSQSANVKSSTGKAPETREPNPQDLKSSAASFSVEGAGKSADRIGQYRLLQEIGHGGCGIVYMAEQEEPVRRRVALKVIKLGMDTRQFVARFEVERQALALMDHPNIAKVFDAGASETGRPYFVMELVGGVKITDFCDQNNLSMRERVDLFVQVCRAVQHAHQKGVIHRDLKPANVLVSVHDGVPLPKVIDFGIAKAIQEPLTNQTLFTAFDQFMGTPTYMSPEQAERGGLDVDTRSDIYSLGVLLYELLTGKTPFDTKELQAASLAEIRRTIAEKEPMRPSTRLTGELREKSKAQGEKSKVQSPKSKVEKAESETSAQLPPHYDVDIRERIKLLRGDLDWIVMKCLEKDRSRRYETANGLALDLQRYLRSEPIRARPPTRAYQFGKFIRRNRVLVTSLTAIGVVLILGTFISTWEAINARRAEREQARLRLDAQNARQDATDKLWASYLAEARARRISHVAGRRFESLAAIRKAAAIRPSLELRNEAIATMVLTDVRWIKDKEVSRSSMLVSDAPAERYAVTSPDGSVSVRRVSDDAELKRLPAIDGRMAYLWSFTPDGKLLGTIHHEKRLRLWDWERGAVLLEVPDVAAADFSADSSSLVTLQGSNLIFYNFSDLRNPRTVSPPVFALHTNLWHLLFHPSGRQVSVYSEARTNVVILDVASGKTVLELPHPDTLFRVVWHPDGKRLASACANNMVYTWDASTGEQLRGFRVDEVVSIGFNHRGDLLASAGWDGKMRLWDFVNGVELVDIYKAGFIKGFSADDRGLVCGAWDDNALFFFELARGHGERTIFQREKGAEGPGGRVIFSRSGTLLAYQTTDQTRLWDVVAGHDLAALDGVNGGPIGFDELDENLILSGPDGLFRWPIKRPDAAGVGAASKAIQILTQSPGVGGLLSADSKTCVIVGQNQAQVFSTETFAEPVRTGIQPGMRFAALTSDGRLLATGAWHYPGVVVWDAKTGRSIQELPGDEGATVAFSPDDRCLVLSTLRDYRFLAVGSWSETLRIAQPRGNDFPAVMCFSPDGKLFAGTHSRSVVRLFHPGTGRVLADLESPEPRGVASISFNADGTQLAVSEGLGAIRIWDLKLIRKELGAMGLDWEDSPSPARTAKGEESR